MSVTGEMKSLSAFGVDIGRTDSCGDSLDGARASVSRVGSWKMLAL
jgi:hypothetical protein